ncbi:hypothetical protein LQW54_004763 [Pestalotiopsis sp. IQ-011]
MATRRSTRLKTLPVQQPADDKPDVQVNAKGKGAQPRATKRAAATSNVADDGKGEPSRKKTKSKGSVSNAQLIGSVVGANDKFSTLPPECLNMVLDNIKAPTEMSALGRASKTFYSLMMPRLYGRIAVAAMFHAHIPKLIRTLEPHLSIAQKKQLKSEGHVKQIVFGRSDPGRKHAYIVDRYIEEALKNMTNLEVVDTMVLTEPIAEAISSLKSLKALRLCSPDDISGEDLASLARIKQLKHLDAVVSGMGYNSPDVWQPIIRNSATTLESLTIHANHYSFRVFGDWAAKSEGKDGHDLVALKSLSLLGVPFGDQLVKDLSKAVDFTQLHELRLSSLTDADCLFFPFLTSQFSSFQGTTDVPLSLRTLHIEMESGCWHHNEAQLKALFEAKCRFISSFDTLTTLELPGYGQDKGHNTTGPPLADAFLQAIFKHKNLRVLRLSYRGVMSDRPIPYLDGKTVGTIVDGLPQLKEFEFAPIDEQMLDIGKELRRASHLEKVICSPYKSWATGVQEDDPGFKIMSDMISGFLSQPLPPPKATGEHKKFRWEDYYKLNQVSLVFKVWDIASDFGKSKKGDPKKGTIQVDGPDGTRSVSHRLVRLDQRIHVGYDPDFPFLEKAG